MAPIVSTLALSAHLKLETKDLHRWVETKPWVRDFLKGRLPFEAWVAHQRMLLTVYRSLEAAIEGHLPPNSFDWNEVARSSALEADLHRLGAEPVPSTHPAAVDYANHIEAVAARQPVGLFGHAYCRYLGDLSGGQILARLSGQHFGPRARDLEFHRFGRDPKVLKEAFKAMLDDLRLGEDERITVVNEAKHAFTLNGTLFDAAHSAAPDTPHQSTNPSTKSSPTATTSLA